MSLLSSLGKRTYRIILAKARFARAPAIWKYLGVSGKRMYKRDFENVFTFYPQEDPIYNSNYISLVDKKVHIKSE